MSDPTCNRAVVVKQRLQQVVLAGVRGRPGSMIVSAGVDSDGRLVITLDDGTQVITDPINRPWGSIQGDITDQSDLMGLLADKVDGGTFEQFQQGMTQALAEKLAIDVYNQFVLDVADALAGKVGDDDPRLSDSRTPTGGAGGVLSGQYPNPGFAVDMATQAELDAVADAKVDTADPRLTDSREWSAATVTQAEAETGTAATRRAWTAQRVRQAIVAWWNGASSAWGRGFVSSADDTAGRSYLGLGTIATQNATNITLTSSTSGQVPLTLTKVSGLGTILRVDKATDSVSYFAIESGTGQSPLLPAFRAFSDSATFPALYLVGDSPADKDAGNTPMVMISGRIANGTVANRPLLHIANQLSMRISVAADGSLRSVAPIRPGAYTVATLPSTADTGAEAYATNGRKAGESAGAGTGVPVYYQGGWRTYYDNSIVMA